MTSVQHNISTTDDINNTKRNNGKDLFPVDSQNTSTYLNPTNHSYSCAERKIASSGGRDINDKSDTPAQIPFIPGHPIVTETQRWPRTDEGVPFMSLHLGTLSPAAIKDSNSALEKRRSAESQLTLFAKSGQQ